MTINAYQFTVEVLYTESSGTDISESVSNVLGLYQQVNVELPLSKTPSSALGLSDWVLHLVIPSGISQVENPLSLVQTVDVYGLETVSSDLSLSQSVVYQGPTTFSTQHANFLSHSVSFTYGVRNLTIEDDLNLNQSVASVFPQTVAHTLNLVDDADRLNLTAENTIVLVDTAEWGYGGDAVSPLGLVQTVVSNYETIKSVTQDNIVTQAAAWFVESRCARSQRTDFHGTGGVAPEPERLQYKSTFLLQSKITGEVLQLRNPETDNRYRYAFERVNRRFYDNSLDLYADPNWVTTHTQLYTVVATKREDMDSLWQFLQDNLGMEVLLKDWKGVTWNVVITDPGQLYAEDQEGYWTVDFEVVGEALDGEFVPQELALTHEVSRAGSIWTRSVEDTVVLTDSVGRNYDMDDVGHDTYLNDTATFTVE